MPPTDKDLLTETGRPGLLTPPDRVSYDEGVLLDALEVNSWDGVPGDEWRTF